MAGLFKILRHAFVMVGRTLRSYALLSVTIVLSFGLLLGYLLYTDSSLYNEHKYTMSLDPDSVAVTAVGSAEISKLAALQEKLEDLGTSHSFITKSIQCNLTQSRHVLDDGRPARLPLVNVTAVPARCWKLYVFGSSGATEVERLDGRDGGDVSLASGEMLMSAGLFHAPGLDGSDSPVYTLDLNELYGIQSKTGFNAAMKVVGTFTLSKFSMAVSDVLTEEILTGDGDNFDTLAFVEPCIVIPIEDYDPEEMEGVVCQYVLQIATDEPAMAVQAARQLGFTNISSSYEDQQSAIEKMRTENRTKAVIAAAMLIILGINLYSSFINAMNERRFEIGVKRAIGASAWLIVRQFLYESLIVMLVNILLSVALVTDLSILYKAVYEATPDKYGFYHQFTLALSRYSAGMFAVCTLSLTIIFSLIFAYKSTQVEIIDYLKAE